MPALLENYPPVTARPPHRTGRRRLADGAAHLRRVGLQSARPDHARPTCARLQPAWVFSTGVNSGHEAAPIVNDGVMFVVHARTPGGRHRREDRRAAVALHASRCPRRSWRRIRPRAASRSTATRSSSPPTTRCWSRSTRAPAREVWTAKVAENKDGYYMTLAPLVAERQGDGGRVGRRTRRARVRGRLRRRHRQAALAHLHRARAGRAGQRDVAEGRSVEDRRRADLGHGQLRSRHQPGVSGAPATAARGWATSVRATTSTPRPRSPSTWRPGAIKGHHQYHPNDSWDWDEVSPPILVDYQRNGRTIKGLIDVARNGYLWFLERTDGPIKFVEGKPYVQQNGVPQPRPDDRPARRRPGAQARHRQDRRTSARRTGAARTGRRWPSARRPA